MSTPTHSFDMFVIGGGPAGLSAAILAAQCGMSVAVADHNRPPIDKACGEGLMPDTLAALQTLGIALAESDGAPFRGIRFSDASGETSVEASFANGFALGLRRTALHAKLAERAAMVGIALLWGSRVSLEDNGRVSCDGRRVRCKYLIGADGEASPVRSWARLERTRFECLRFGARRHFRVHPWSDFVDVYWVPGCQIIVAPVARDELCVSVVSRDPRLKFDDAISHMPLLASRLRGLTPLNHVRGARAASRRLKRVCNRSVALVGDASGSIDPLTGEGIGLGMHQAAALLDAIQRDDLNSYRAAHDRIGRVQRAISRLMLAMDAHPRLCRRALRVFAAEPLLFSRLLNLHVGELSLSRFGPALAMRLGWRLVHPLVDS